MPAGSKCDVELHTCELCNFTLYPHAGMAFDIGSTKAHILVYLTNGAHAFDLHTLEIHRSFDRVVS